MREARLRLSMSRAGGSWAGGVDGCRYAPCFRRRCWRPSSARPRYRSSPTANPGGFSSRRSTRKTQRPHRRVPVGPSGGGGGDLRCGHSAASSVVSSVNRREKSHRPGSTARTRVRVSGCAQSAAGSSVCFIRKRPVPGWAPAVFSGGGGSRTRVRERVLSSFYVRSSLRGFALGVPANSTVRASCRKSRSSRGNGGREPARLVVASGPASGGPVRRRACVVTQPVPDRCWQL